MFIDKDSIKIGLTSMGQYLTSVTFGYNKLWSNDSGRNLAGKMTGTLIGIFPKITMNFRPLTKNELITVSRILDSQNQRVTYYDPYKNANVTMTTYTGDWSVKNDNIMENEGFSISFISISKRV